MPAVVVEKARTTPLYSFSALRSKQREVKDRADTEVVHITENGNAAYVFCSEEVFAQEKAKAAAEALYERELIASLERAHDDLDSGRTYHGVEAVREALAQGSARG